MNGLNTYHQIERLDMTPVRRMDPVTIDGSPYWTRDVILRFAGGLVTISLFSDTAGGLVVRSDPEAYPDYHHATDAAPVG
jgi:hypothetical protein